MIYMDVVYIYSRWKKSLKSDLKCLQLHLPDIYREMFDIFRISDVSFNISKSYCISPQMVLQRGRGRMGTISITSMDINKISFSLFTSKISIKTQLQLALGDYLVYAFMS